MEITGNSISEYTASGLTKVKAMCLSIAQILGDTIQDEAVIVGGLVPTLLYQDVEPVWEYGGHAGTHDMDIALDLVILEKERYEAVAECLRRAKFAPDENSSGNLTRQRWRSPTGATVDFLMPPVPPEHKVGHVQSLTNELAAITMKGLDLALRHRVLIPLEGADIERRNVKREVPVCPAEVFVALKAIAIAHRDKAKDAYDIDFTLRHDPRRALGLGEALLGLGPHDAITAAVESLRRDYQSVDGRGPSDVCKFLGQRSNEELAGQAYANVLDFLRPFLS